MTADSLDLSSEGNLNEPESTLYDQIAQDIRSEYTDFIGSLVTDCSKNNLDWWLEAPATRNHVFSRLFHQIVALLTVEKLLKEGKAPKSIVVDSVEMDIVVSALTDKFGVKIQVRPPDFIIRNLATVRSLVSPYRSMARLFIEWLVVRSTGGFTAPDSSSDESLILIDTFAIPGFIDSDRYYPGLYEHSGASKHRIRFVPQFFNLGIGELKSASKLLRSHPEKYILKEDYLALKDMFWCFGHLIRLSRIDLKGSRFRNFDVTALVQADINKRSAFRCALRGLMNFRFAKNLRFNGVKVSKSIDWFENHPMDRGWNAGFNEFFPDARRVGYTGFYPAGQSYRPTVHESKAGVLPPKHLIIGEGFIEDLSEFHPDCKIETAPAFRYQYLPALDSRKHEPGLILVAMPYFLEMCVHIVRIIGLLQNKQQQWTFIIKPHPAQPVDDIVGIKEILKRNSRLTTRPISGWLNKCTVMLTGAQASTILEASACAVPTIIVAESASSGQISIPNAVPKELYSVCVSAIDVEHNILKILRSNGSLESDRFDLAWKFRRRCFSPVTDQTVNHMLVN
jgi:hypothetical protein